MKTTRRNLLKGMAAIGSISALSLMTPLWARSSTKDNVHLIITNDPVGQAFSNGVHAVKKFSVHTTLQSSISIDFIKQYQTLLQKGQGQRILGLVDDANAVLILDLARSSNARVIWQKDHLVQSTDAAKNLGSKLLDNPNSKNIAATETAMFNKHYVSFLIES